MSTVSETLAQLRSLLEGRKEWGDSFDAMHAKRAKRQWKKPPQRKLSALPNDRDFLHAVRVLTGTGTSVRRMKEIEKNILQHMQLGYGMSRSDAYEKLSDAVDAAWDRREGS